MSTNSPDIGTGSHTVGPPLPAEIPKPPYTPSAAGRIAFFFGPFAGAMVSTISLRRMRHPEKARKAASVASLGAVLLALLLFFTPEAFSRIIGLVAEIAFYVTFKRMQEHEFAEWQAANADVQPSNGWKAVGWGILGLILMVGIFFGVAIVLGLFGIEPR